MEWFTVEQLDTTTFAISEYGHWEQVRSFLLVGTKKALLIDTGLGIGNMAAVVRELTSLPIQVVLTHVHWDHIGGVADFSSIAVHETDAQWLMRGIPAWSDEAVRKELVRDITQPLPKEFKVEAYVLPTLVPQQLLTDGDRLTLGDRHVEVIHTPGHSPGHISLLDSCGYLFPGDILYSSETPVYAHYPSTDPVALADSVERIANLDVQRIFASHNQLELPVTVLSEAATAVAALREQQLLRHGTGLHQFQGFSFLF